MLAKTFTHQPPDAVTFMSPPQRFLGDRHPQPGKPILVQNYACSQAIDMKTLAVLENPLELLRAGQTHTAREARHFLPVGNQRLTESDGRGLWRGGRSIPYGHQPSPCGRESRGCGRDAACLVDRFFS